DGEKALPRGHVHIGFAWNGNPFRALAQRYHANVPRRDCKRELLRFHMWKEDDIPKVMLVADILQEFSLSAASDTNEFYVIIILKYCGGLHHRLKIMREAHVSCIQYNQFSVKVVYLHERVILAIHRFDIIGICPVVYNNYLFFGTIQVSCNGLAHGFAEGEYFSCTRESRNVDPLPQAV